MPGRTRTTTKYSTVQEGEFRFRVLDVLNNSEEALTIDEIKSQDMILQPLTTQKLSRVLGNLIEMGLVRKAKSRRMNRMVYKAVAKMVEQGYDIEEVEECS